MFDRRSVFHLSIPGVLLGIFLCVIGAFAMGMSVSEFETAPDQALAWAFLVGGILAVFLGICFITGITSYLGATVIAPLLIQQQDQDPEPEPIAPAIPPQVVRQIPDVPRNLPRVAPRINTALAKPRALNLEEIRKRQEELK